MNKHLSALCIAFYKLCARRQLRRAYKLESKARERRIEAEERLDRYSEATDMSGFFKIPSLEEKMK